MAREPLRRLRIRLRRRAEGMLARLPRRAPAPEPLALESVRRRLELLVAALHGRAIPIEPLRPARRHPLLRALFGPPPAVLPESDAARVRLPAALEAGLDPRLALARYQMLALTHAARVARGSAALVPEAPLERDLYLVAEAAAAERAAAGAGAAVRAALDDAHVAALRARPPLDGLSAAERAVEGLLRRVLGDATAPASAGDPSLPDGDPVDSLLWARETAARLAAGGARYRGAPPVAHWGEVRPAPEGDPYADAMREAALLRASRALDSASTASKAGRPDEPPSDRDAKSRTEAGATSAPGKTDTGHGGGARGGARAPDDGDARRERVEEEQVPADVPSTLVPAEPPPAGEPSLDPVDEASRVVGTSSGSAARVVAEYPEWDVELGHARRGAVAVREREAAETEPTWATETLAEHAVLVRRVRQHFERLRSRRARLPRQRDGDDLDLDAVVGALAERRAGHAMSERLYAEDRPGRRALAITLLVDVSGSTETAVTSTRRVIDVEKEAVLLAGEAFDALGDRWSVMTFSSWGARDVRLTPIKRFAERNGDTVRRRISAMAPDGNTRLGAAVRHAATLLAREPAGHRLLLVLSDGKPNDSQRYYERYAVEDSRRAVLEARAMGVAPFCLTVDREEPEKYLSHVFGVAGHTVLRHPEQLPTALLGVVRQLLSS